MSSNHFEKPRWRVISELVQSRIAQNGDRAAAIAAVSSSLKITHDVVSRALKCNDYVNQHRPQSMVVASQTNIEMLMSLEQIDPASADNYRVEVLNGMMNYAQIRSKFDAIKIDRKNGNLDNVSLDQIKKQMIDQFPFEGIGKPIPPQVDPLWISADMQVVMLDPENNVYEWACIISPLFPASSLRGKGRSGFIKSIAAAITLCEGVGIMAGSVSELDWLSSNIEFICRNSKAMVSLHQFGSQGITYLHKNEGMAKLLGFVS